MGDRKSGVQNVLRPVPARTREDHLGTARRVLVLNASYEPLSLVPVRRALVMLMQNKAELIEAGQRQVRTVNRQWPMPLIIRLCRYIRVPMRVSPPTRSGVMLRDAHTCGYCGVTHAQRRMTIDHILPRSKGGAHVWSNLITACQACNQRKGQRSPEEANMKLRWQPAQPSYVTLVLLRNPVAAERYSAYMNGVRHPA